MHFVSKYLNDNFYLEDDRQISLRDKIFREVISNLLIHREFANPFPVKVIIEKDRVYVENGNKSQGNGLINSDNFSPFPKNPSIAKFFKEIGLADELGSGVRNIYKYSSIYSKAEPTFFEGDVFKTIIPICLQASDHARDQAGVQGLKEEDRLKAISKFCKTLRSRSEIQDFIEVKSRRYFREGILNPLIKEGLLKLTIPEKPTSPKQRYYS